MRDGREIKALQIGGPLGGILPAVAARHPVRLRRARRRGLHGRPRQASSASTSAPTCARSRATCCTSARTRAAASASPAGSACGARTRCSAADAPVDRARLEELLETLELGEPVRARRRHAGPDPQPARALPRRAGAGADARHDRRRRARGASRARPCSRRSARPARGVPTLCFDERQAPFGACRVCLVGAGGRARGRCRPARPRAATGMAIDTQRPDGRGASCARRRRARALRAAGRPARAPTPSSPRVARRAGLGGRPSQRWRGRHPRGPTTTSATPTWPSSTSCASPAGAACAPATRSRGPSR